jgi:hypothetical protein
VLTLQVYKNLLLKFLKPAAFASTELLAVDPNIAYNQKPSKDIVVRHKTQQFIREKFKEEKQKKFLKMSRPSTSKRLTT